MRLVTKIGHESGGSVRTPKQEKSDLEFFEAVLQSKLQLSETLPEVPFNEVELRQQIHGVAETTSPSSDSALNADASLLVDEVSLAEGHNLFGSLFSLIEKHVGAENPEPRGIIPQNKSVVSALTSIHVFKGKSEYDRNDAVASTEAVVIDFSKAKSRTGAEIKNANGNCGDQAGESQNSNKSKTSKPVARIDFAEATEIKPLEAFRSEAESTSTVLPSTEMCVQTSIGEITNAQTPQSPINQKSAVASTQRVDQIIPTVVELLKESTSSAVLGNTGEGQAKPSGQTLRLSLRPVELGNVDISISKRGRRLEVTFRPEREETVRLLLSDAQQLLKSLGIAAADGDRVQLRIETAFGAAETLDSNDTLQSSMRQHSESETESGRSYQAKRDQVRQFESSKAHDKGDNEPRNPPHPKRRTDALYI